MRKKFESAVAIATCAAACYCAYVAFARLRRTLSGLDGDLEGDYDEDDGWNDLDWEEGDSGDCEKDGCRCGKGKCGCPGGGCGDMRH